MEPVYRCLLFILMGVMLTVVAHMAYMQKRIEVLELLEEAMRDDNKRKMLYLVRRYSLYLDRETIKIVLGVTNRLE